MLLLVTHDGEKINIRSKNRTNSRSKNSIGVNMGVRVGVGVGKPSEGNDDITARDSCHLCDGRYRRMSIKWSGL